ncbi:MAG: Iron-sulfur cluster carrier protein [Acidimicrobiales bacterium]|nr:MAG: hypothetical protein EDR02_16270 [Actinomycetota bacterium]MBV6508130.1 Iron-sulfur cluster carrier protein [Acidimicrobiales bacterium]RIK03875.1 MAG: hypothetical protein DCC48_15295 [Acidobacteriota bacterium]
MPVVAVVNQKGGVGKTTVALGLASAAAAASQRVLVVDLDPQANATSGMAVWDPLTTVDRALESDADGVLAEVVRPAGWPDEILPCMPDVAPSSPLLAGREPQLANDPIGAQDRLAMAMKGLEHQYDAVIIDCPPSLGLLTVNGLFAARYALVVTEPAAWASDGVEQVLRTISRVSQRRGGALATGGIVINRLGRTRDASFWYSDLVKTYPQLVLPPIRLRTAVAEAAAQAIPIHGVNRSGAAEAAREFERVLQHLPDVFPAGAAGAGPFASPEPVSSGPLPSVPARE